MQFPARRSMNVENTTKTAPPSEPPKLRGKRASRKRSLRGRGPSGKTTRQSCKNLSKSSCSKLPCDSALSPECQFKRSVFLAASMKSTE